MLFEVVKNYSLNFVFSKPLTLKYIRYMLYIYYIYRMYDRRSRY